MKRLLLILLFLPLLGYAQLFEDFSDGNFTHDPVWTGTTENYIINEALQLQLNASEAGSSWLSTPYTNPGGNVEWNFWIRLAFAPSANNLSEVYLISDQADLTSALNGYFLRFGEAGSADAIELYRKEATQVTRIFRGEDGLIAGSFQLFVKVIRTESGEWSLFVDPSGNGIYSLQASGTDNSFEPGGYFGFYGKYTVSNSTKMYYDDIRIDTEHQDTEPPFLLSAQATDPFSIHLVFNEGITENSLLNKQNYHIDNNIGRPMEVVAGMSAAQAVLQLPSPLDNGQMYTLTIKNLEDFAGNIMEDTSVNISYYEAQYADVVINEIMADPSPPVELPDWEYIELYNTTNIPISLDGWKLMIGNTEKIIGAIQIEPEAYLLLGHENAAPELTEYGPFYGFSSFQLANSGASLHLIAKQGHIISSVSYTDKWYHDNNKKDGGWSIEQKDPGNPCGGRNNWTASEDSRGGTPGKVNSVYEISTTGARAEQHKLIGNQIIQLWFDQQMDAVSMGNKAHYELRPSDIRVLEATLNPAEPDFVELRFDKAFSSGIIYQLHISEAVLNCVGRPVEPNSFIEFGIPDVATEGDIVINEILFNPFAEGADFVELYNRSDKIINLEELRLGAVRQSIPNPPDTVLREISQTTRLIMPGTYVLLSTDTAAITRHYQAPSKENYIEMESFPTYPNEEGTAILTLRNRSVLDVFSYHEKMHFPLLNYVKGVSLERISPDRPSDDPTNWHSAAETIGFASPGYQNSMFVQDTPSNDMLEIDPEIFSPDGDGYNDVTSIRYRFDEAGYTLNIFIYNAAGLRVRHLTKSVLAAQEGAISWDGLDDRQQRLPTGIYIVHAEIFKEDGTVKHLKKAVVIASR